MFTKFATLITKITENCEVMGNSTTAAMGAVSSQYGVGEVTPASEADMSIANMNNAKRKKRKTKDKSGFPKTAQNKPTNFVRRNLPLGDI